MLSLGVEVFTGYSKQTIVDWNSFVLTAWGKVIDGFSRLVGTPEIPVKIDECYVCGCRK